MKKRKKNIVYILVFILCYLALALVIFIHSDITPALNSDYESLEAIAKEVKFPSNNSSTKINNAFLDIENKECRIMVSYDQDLNIIAIQRIDKSESIAILIFATIFFGTILSCIIIFILNKTLYKKEGQT